MPTFIRIPCCRVHWELNLSSRCSSTSPGNAGRIWSDSHRFGLLTGNSHNWIYRGQILPENRLITVEAVVTEVKEHPFPTITAEGYLQVDGLYIYKMENFGIKLVEI